MAAAVIIAREQRGRSSKSLQHSKTRDLNFQDLEGLYVPGEVVKLGLSFAHLPEPAQLIYSSHNPGAVSFGEEMVRAITGLTLVREANSGLFEEEDEPTNEFMMGDRVLHKKHVSAPGLEPTLTGEACTCWTAHPITI